MTRSDNIKEFLKYASPRLEYIEHCMEKQALSPQTYLKAISKLKSLNLKDDDAAKLYSRLTELSKSDKLQNLATTKKKSDRISAMKGALEDRRKSKGLTELKPRKGWEAPSSKPNSKPESKEKYADLFDFNAAGTDFLTHIRTQGRDAAKPYAAKFKSGFLADPRVIQEAANRGITPEALFDEVAKYYASGFRGAPGANSRGLRGLFDAATEGKYYNYKRSPLEPITDWTKDHPIATPLIAAGVTNIPTAGISYAIGSSNGEDRGVANADAYYRAIMAHQASALQNANGDLLSRLANVFGAGDLNKIIDGYYN
jgi:hypothetical protein